MRVLFLLMILALSQPVFAWGADGHRLTCRIAYDALSAEGKTWVQQTLALGEHLDGNSSNNLAEACLWPDEARFNDYKGTYEQHFINMPRGASRIDFARDCAAMDCIAVGIQRSLTYLAAEPTSNRERARKAAALRFLGHFIADLHQPLHVAYGDDWGGNKIQVDWFGQTMNLHAVWDTGILERAGISYPASLQSLAALNPDLGSRNVLDWMQETFNLARSHAYPGIDGQPILSGAVLTEAYYQRSLPVASGQLRLGATRLAWLLDQLARGQFDTNILIN
ncbi:MAG: S1/P1 nuclease [Pseudomonadota bacterium]